MRRSTRDVFEDERRPGAGDCTRRGPGHGISASGRPMLSNRQVRQTSSAPPVSVLIWTAFTSSPRCLPPTHVPRRFATTKILSAMNAPPRSPTKHKHSGANAEIGGLCPKQQDAPGKTCLGHSFSFLSAAVSTQSGSPPLACGHPRGVFLFSGLDHNASRGRQALTHNICSGYAPNNSALWVAVQPWTRAGTSRRFLWFKKSNVGCVIPVARRQLLTIEHNFPP